MAVTWAAEQADATAITVYFEGGAEHERLWQHFQSRAYGVAVTPLPSVVPADDDESLQARRMRVLSLAEAFYLLTVDKCLAAPASFGSHEQIYERFSHASHSIAQRFQHHVVVQLHFRQLGWVLKSGLNYGSHYVLYRGAANEYHSEYIVYVKGSQEALSWGVVQALTRVAADVKKTILVCDIEQLNADADGGEAPDTESTLMDGKYTLYGQRSRFTAVAIRFFDVADSQAAAEPLQSQSFAFQPQLIQLKKKKWLRHKTKRPRSER